MLARAPPTAAAGGYLAIHHTWWSRWTANMVLSCGQGPLAADAEDGVPIKEISPEQETRKLHDAIRLAADRKSKQFIC